MSSFFQMDALAPAPIIGGGFKSISPEFDDLSPVKLYENVIPEIFRLAGIDIQPECLWRLQVKGVTPLRRVRVDSFSGVVEGIFIGDGPSLFEDRIFRVDKESFSPVIGTEICFFLSGKQ